MSNTENATSTTMQSVLNALGAFTRKFPPSRLPVSVRGNRAFIDKLRQAARKELSSVTRPAPNMSSDSIYGLKIIEDESVAGDCHYIKYADGHEEWVTMFGTFVREAIQEGGEA